jgi:hypothetical protein
VREHAQQARILELQLGDAGEDANRQRAFAPAREEIGAVEEEGRARAVLAPLREIGRVGTRSCASDAVRRPTIVTRSDTGWAVRGSTSSMPPSAVTPSSE